MCLRTKQAKPLRATRDMKVYKVLNVQDTSLSVYKVVSAGKKVYRATVECQLHSTVKGFNYELGKTYTTQLQTEHYGSVERGFHSYDYKSPRTVGNHEVGTIVECVIPKGSLYFKGSNNGKSKGIISNKIRIVKVV